MDSHDTRSNFTLSTNEIGLNLKKIAETMTQVAWTALPDGRIEFLNDRGLLYIGQTREQVELWGWSAAFVQKDFAQLQRIILNAAKNGTDYEFECSLLHSPTRAHRWNIIRGVAFRNSKDEVERWFGTWEDNHDSKSGKTKSSEVNLQQVIDSIPSPIWWKDKDSVYLGCNMNSAQKAGLTTPLEMIGKTDFDLPWRDIADDFHAGDKLAMQSKTGTFHDLQSIDFDGKTSWFDTNKVAFYDSEGNILGTVGSSLEVTSLIKLTQQREDFMASLAHDLKVPIIGAIRAFDVLIAGMVGPLTTDQAAFVNKLQHSHQHLLDLIKNLLQVLRYEASADVLHITKCDLTRVLRACASDLQSASNDKNIEIITELPEEAMVKADPLAMQRLLTNLIGNAIKFTPKNGQINISLKMQNADIIISVSDTGTGISKEDQKKLFQRFWQGGSVKKYTAETGLGLYLCRQIVEGHGGLISVESDEGEGATFVVTLPSQGPKTKVELRLEK